MALAHAAAVEAAQLDGDYEVELEEERVFVPQGVLRKIQHRLREARVPAPGHWLPLTPAVRSC